MDVINARMNNPQKMDEMVRRGQLHPLKWISRRETTGNLYGPSKLDNPSQTYTRTKFFKGLYNSFGHSTTWNNPSGNPYQYGAVFNFDFTPDGSTLVAASERRSILMFDPLTHKMHQAKTDAHADCVNVVKFIDNRLFATCSDDRTVKLWDLRNMDKEVQTLTGHTNWVKNIECIGGRLLTSGFDGNIIMWDYHTYTENGEVPHKVLFQTRNLMRTALSADQTKLVMSTSGGYIMVVHDFDIDTIADDLNGFKPNIYRLMQMNPSTGSNSIAYNHLFQDNRKSNRLELIADFTENVDVEIIASLKIHPSGNFFVSRNTSSDEQCEHTCVHDLRHTKLRKPVRIYDDDEGQSSASTSNNMIPQLTTTNHVLYSHNDTTANGVPMDLTIGNNRQIERQGRRLANCSDRDRSRSRSPVMVLPSVEEAADPAERAAMMAQVPPEAQQRLHNLTASYANTSDQYMIFIQGGRDGVHQTLVLFADDKRTVRRPQAQKHAKMLYYVEEPNMGRGFIKEPCFSNDGRIICSPFAHGVRLLGFDSECHELETKVQEPGSNKPVELQEVASVYPHQNLVVATKYSPTHQLLVTGCLDGQVGFHQPLL